MKNRKLLGGKELHPKRIHAKSMSIPKTAGPGSFLTYYSTPTSIKPAYNFSAN